MGMDESRVNVKGDFEVSGPGWVLASQGITAPDGVNLFEGPIPTSRAIEWCDEWRADVYPLTYTVTNPETGDEQSYESSRVIVVGTGKANDGVEYYVPASAGGAGYSVQNRDGDASMIEKFAHAVGDSPNDLHLSSLLALRNGGRLVATVSAGEQLKDTRSGVVATPHLFYATSRDGSLRNIFGRSVTLAICENTFAMALSEASNSGLVSFKNTKNAEAQFDTVALKLGIEQVAEEWQSQLDKLIETEVSDLAFQRIIETAFPIKDSAKQAGITRIENYRETVTELYNNDERVSPWRGTAFGAFQAINTFQLWEREVRGDTDPYMRAQDELLSGTREVGQQNTFAVIEKGLALASLA